MRAINWLLPCLSILLCGCATLRENAPAVTAGEARSEEQFWLPAMRTAGILHQDGGNPILFPGGSLWTFGDSFTGRWKADGSPDYSGAVTNTAMLYSSAGQRYLPVTGVSDGMMLPLVKPETWKTTRIWPGAGIYLNGEFYAYYAPVSIVNTGLGFEGGNACGLAKTSGGDWTKWHRIQLPSPLPFKEVPQAMVDGRDGFIYAYYIEKDGFDSRVRAVRFRPQNIEVPSAYEQLPSKLADRVYGQVSVEWNARLGLFVMCHAGDIFRDPRSIMLRFSASPAGPFGAPAKVFGDGKPAGKDLSGAFYCAYLHPELEARDPRRLWITYCEVNEKYGLPKLISVPVNRKSRPAK